MGYDYRIVVHRAGVDSVEDERGKRYCIDYLCCWEWIWNEVCCSTQREESLMSTFEVKVRQLDDILPHPNADKLELAVVGGYRAVVKKGEFKPGDLALYIPTDSVIRMDVAEGLGVQPYLVGKQKNRVKAIRLRGEVSQGIVVPFDTFDAVMVKLGFGYQSHKADVDYANELAIIKYEEEIPIEMQGHVRPWPEYLDHYDVENVNHPDCINLFQPGEEVVATEKLHGTNMAVSIGPGLDEGEQVFVCSRRLAIKESENNLYWIAAKKHKLIDAVTNLWNGLVAHYGYNERNDVTIRGEVVGIQDIKYGFTRSEPGFYAFDIRINGAYIPSTLFKSICRRYEIPTVVEVFQGPYDYDLLKRIAQMPSAMNGELREGIVVRPIEERRDDKIGRVILKFLNEDYLTRKEGTELH